MRFENVKPISEIREAERKEKEKEAKITHLEAEVQTLKEQNMIMQETINYLLGL